MSKEIKLINPWAINPCLMYILLWGVTWLLYIISPSKLNPKIDSYFFLFIIGTFLVAAYFAYKFNRKFKNKIFVINHNKNYKIEICSLIVLYLLDFAYGGNIPLLSILNGIDQEVKNSFGIPVLHVFIVTYTMFAVSRDLFHFIILKRRDTLIIPAIGIAYLIMLFTRAALINILVVVTLLFCSFTQIRLKRILQIISICIVLFWIFGVTGNIRVGYEWNDSYVILQLGGIDVNRYNVLAPFYWVEEYIICSLRNLNYNLLYQPTYSFADLVYYNIPDFISKRIVDVRSVPKLVSFTTYTAYGGSYVSFGYPGMMLTFISHLLLFSFIIKNRVKMNANILLALSFMSFIMLLSVFDNMIHITTHFMPIIYIIIIQRYRFKLKVK